MKCTFYILSIAFVFILNVLPVSAQVDKKDVRHGNADFKKGNYKEAEIDYRKALIKDSLSVAANYNLANTLYREGDMEQAGKVLERIKDVAPSTSSASDYYYNLGDVAIAKQDWQGAVDAFKNALLLNPGDMDAKENYIYAKKKLEDHQNQDNQNQDNQNQNQDQNNDQNQDDQNKDQNQDNQDQDNKDQNQDNQNPEHDKQDDQRKQQPQQEPKITPQAAQQMLQAIQAKEKETQDKVNKQKAEALKSRQKDKNW